MFGSCRLCQRATDKWQDFCNDCATADAGARRAPTWRVIQGGKREWERPGREREKSFRWLQPVSKPPSASPGN